MSGPGGLPILTFHALDASGAVTATDPSRFAAILDALRDAGYRGVALDDWVAAGRPAVDRRFALAFDDGLRSILDVADRVARDQIPATVFLLSGRIGGDNRWPGQPASIPRSRLLDLSEIRTLAGLGFRFGSHGLDHARLDRVDPGDLDAELVDSRYAIEQITGRPCTLLAYPYGRANRRVRLAASRHYEGAFGTRLAYAGARGDRFDLARIDAYYLRSGKALDLLVSGRWRPHLAARRLLRSARGLVPTLGRA